jgi:tRNA threonylcarbamoyl adenosine modification protein YeaZ
LPTLKDNPTILALETAIGGGSISVCRNGSEIAFIAGDDSVSRSEELLPNIKTLFAQAHIEPTDIDLIAVSRGPGSFTGIRIGLATALGLSRSLDIPCVGVPLFDAIAAVYRNDFPLTVILPMGKNEVVWKAFSDTHSVSSEGSVCSIDDVWSMIDDSTTTALVHESLMLRFPALASGMVSKTQDPSLTVGVPTPAQPPASSGGTHSMARGPSLTVGLLTPNLAKLVACDTHRWTERVDLSPIYIQNPAKRSNLF